MVRNVSSIVLSQSSNTSLMEVAIICYMKNARDILSDNLTFLMSNSAGLKSQNALSKRSKVGQTTISNYLRPDSAVQSASFDVLEKLAKTFGITVAQLLTENLGRNQAATCDANQTVAPYHSDMDRLFSASSSELRALIETLLEAESSRSLSPRAIRAMLELSREISRKPEAGKDDWPGLAED